MAFHQYNAFRYNTAQYNADAIFWVKACVESVASSDVSAEAKVKALVEALTSTDARLMSTGRALVEFLFLADVVAKSVLNKGFTESIRTNDWLEIERKSQNNGNGWS